MRLITSFLVILLLSACMIAPRYPQAKVSADGKTLTFEYLWLKQKAVAEVSGPDVEILPQRLRPYMLDSDWHYYRAQYCVPYDNQCGIAISQLDNRIGIWIMGGVSGMHPLFLDHDIGPIDYQIIDINETLF